MQNKQLPLYLGVNPNDKKKGMYLIGEFSKIAKVSIDTIRHYEDVGILLPHFVDEETGYRYYSVQELQRLKYIRKFVNVGFTLKEIKKLDDVTGKGRITILKDKKNEYQTIIDTLNKLIEEEEKK